MGVSYSEVESENGSVIEYDPNTRIVRSYHENLGCFTTIYRNTKKYIYKRTNGLRSIELPRRK
jgi:hypothetical protein